MSAAMLTLHGADVLNKAAMAPNRTGAAVDTSSNADIISDDRPQPCGAILPSLAAEDKGRWRWSIGGGIRISPDYSCSRSISTKLSNILEQRISCTNRHQGSSCNCKYNPRRTRRPSNS